MANKKKKKIESFDQLANMQQRRRPAASEEEPTISSMLDEFEMWMALNWKKAIIGVCAFAVAISIVIIIQGMIRRAELEAAIAKHSSNKAVDFARLRLAGALIATDTPDDLAKAREQLLAVAASSKSEKFIRIRAALDAAYILEKLGKKEDAAVEFERIAADPQISSDLRVEANYSAARIFVGLDKTMNANAALKNINFNAAAAQGPFSVEGYWASRAKQLNEKIRPQTATETPAPAEKPAETSAEKPAETPAEKPAETPVETPAAVPAAVSTEQQQPAA